MPQALQPLCGGSAPPPVPPKGASPTGCSNSKLASCTQHQDGTRLPMLYHLFHDFKLGKDAFFFLDKLFEGERREWEAFSSRWK